MQVSESCQTTEFGRIVSPDERARQPYASLCQTHLYSEAQVLQNPFLTRGCPVHRPATPNRSVCHVPARRPRPARQMSIYGRQIWLKNGLNFNTSEMLIRLSALRSKRRCRETRTYGVEHPAVLQHVRRLFLTEGETELERDNRLATELQDVLPAFRKAEVMVRCGQRQAAF
jgi:hypothetical protein